MRGPSMAVSGLAGRFCQFACGLAMPEKSKGGEPSLTTRKNGLNGRPLAGADRVLEALSGGECRNGLGVDLDLLAVGRAAAGARLALARQEGPESDHGDAVALGDAGYDGIEHGVDRFTGCGLAQIPGARRSMNEIRFRDNG